MCNDKIIRRMAGIMVLLSVALGFMVSDTFFWFTAFIGANLLQSSFTNFCREPSRGRFRVRIDAVCADQRPVTTLRRSVSSVSSRPHTSSQSRSTSLSASS
jgi:hypothetical protein